VAHRNALYKLGATVGRIERHAAPTENHSRGDAIRQRPLPAVDLLRRLKVRAFHRDQCWAFAGTRPVVRSQNPKPNRIVRSPSWSTSTSKQVGDSEHIKVLANQDAAETWFEENDPEGVAFEYEILE